RVMQRAGMLKEGTLRHHYHFDGKWHDGISYSITRDMWMKSKRRLKVRVNSQEDLKRLARVRCFVLDMDGTIYLEDQLLEGSREFLDYIADEDIRALFLTNNSSKCAQDYVEKLLSMGIGALRQDVLTSGEAAADYVRREYGAVRVYVMGNESLKDELRGAGIEVVEDRPDIVVAGFDTTMSYRSMTVVCDLMRQGLPLIATHPDFNCPVQGGFVPDLGAMLAFIEASTGKRPDVVVGKPHEEIIRCIMHRTGLSKDHLAIVGDRLYTDIATGANAGILSVLMLTGETKMQDLETSDVQPDLVFENMQELRSVLAKAHRQ
ncbi:MAG: HAD-IIA family hydrolase, partial [Christensenellales bacterium]